MGWILGIVIPVVWIVCSVWATRIWFDHMVRGWVKGSGLWGGPRPNNVDLALVAMGCLMFGPILLAAGLIAEREHNWLRWFSPTLASMDEEGDT